jgi:CDP-glucose 4,6-dehydratase
METLGLIVQLESFYRNKKVLVTGHTGFKGAWLSIWLKMMGADVIGYALDPIYENSIFELSFIQNDIRDIRADIRDLDKLKNVVSNEKPEIVFHLAAQPLVLNSIENPLDTFAVNITGTVNLLEAIRCASSVKSAIFITSDKCYENQEWVYGYRETEAMGGKDPYSASKGAAEIAIHSYRRTYFESPSSPGVASVRAGNVIGGGDWSANRLVPDIVRAIEKNIPVEIRNPYATRPWQYVIEPLRGYLMLAEKLFSSPREFSGAWNFGPFMTETCDVETLVQTVIKYLGKGNYSVKSRPTNTIESNLLNLDFSKAFHFLGWKPLLNFAETIAFTMDWYNDYHKGDILSYSRNQITEYLTKWN